MAVFALAASVVFSFQLTAINFLHETGRPTGNKKYKCRAKDNYVEIGPLNAKNLHLAVADYWGDKADKHK